MCEAMWIVASFHSTSFPFIQIVPVSGKAMAMRSFWQSYNASLGNAQCQGDTALVGGWWLVVRGAPGGGNHLRFVAATTNYQLLTITTNRYCASLQNGHLSVRAWSGLRQCQQKRGWGVSRALRRDWMSATFSVLPATADWARRTLARAAAGSRAASRSSSSSEARW